MALWDLAGKVAGLRSYGSGALHTDRSSPMPAWSRFARPRSGRGRLAPAGSGYPAIKLRLHSATVAEDIAQVEAVRDAVGDRMDIMVDAIQAQEPGPPVPRIASRGSMIAPLSRPASCTSLACLWLEEPLARYDFDTLGRLAATTDLPIAGGENNMAFTSSAR